MKINQIVFDCQNKEYVKISNGIHIAEGKPEIIPTEAIALRIIDVLKSGKPQIAYVYRSVKADKLSPLTHTTDTDHFNTVFSGLTTAEHFQFVGRV